MRFLLRDGEALGIEGNLIGGLLAEAANIPDANLLPPLRERFQAAADRFRTALAVVSGNDADVLRVIADGLINLGEGGNGIFAPRHALLVETKAYDEALRQLEADMPPEFAPLVADRRGDIYNLQGQTAEARSEYEKAWKGLQAQADYRRLVEVKLTALGVDPRSLAGDKAGGARS